MAPRAEPTNAMDHMDSEEDVSAPVSLPSKVEGVSVGFADLTYEVPLKGKGKKKGNNSGEAGSRNACNTNRYQLIGLNHGRNKQEMTIER